MTVPDYVRERLLEPLERDVLPWREPWTGQPCARNFISHEPYTSISRMLLGLAGFVCPYWVTPKQAEALESTVRIGQHPYYWIEKCPHGAKLRPVYNLQQLSGIKWYPPFKGNMPATWNADQIIRKWMAWDKVTPFVISSNDKKGRYITEWDTIMCPSRYNWKCIETYYACMFHECIHATGHPDRLARPVIVNQEKKQRSAVSRMGEEVVAEVGAAFLCQEAGLYVPDGLGYEPEKWIQFINKHTRLFLLSCDKGQEAADYILREGEDVRKDHDVG
jgi:antirestriction protein ArdC